MVHRWRRAFLAGLEKTGSVTQACELAKISRVTVYQNRRTDPEFARRWDEALGQERD